MTDLVVEATGLIQIIEVFGICLSAPEGKAGDFKIAPD
jgi:hypothetical protein